ncbi:unnamed protein product [Rotaria sp. Silwood1]|nr:unnamed protein product [Rotaria sp. Silwood1]CAF3341857.1 unnamed protein product [Rotaria sp. Silwood1]CAF3350198.1 unnamed protein product [Rotaria sp. Silwood1]CAF4543530.1 unnamed protein product [Rotaria sp. Silwood1]CAF4688361.1 unnamed protein product [Rotaria sp. Silwood1]
MMCLQISVFAELSPSSCSFIRTATSISTIVPEIAQIAMRYYRASSSSSDQHHRQKRFLFVGNNAPKDTSTSGVKGSVLEQVMVNAFKDVNFTNVALLILNNNETMNKIRRNTNGKAIVHTAMRSIDYEKLGSSIWHAVESEFDLEYLFSNLINITHIDMIHKELLNKGTLPDWLIKSIHPDINVQAVHRMFEDIKNFTRKFIIIMNSSESLDDYLFNMVQQQVLTPLEKVIQKLKDEKPTTLDQLVEIILNNANKIIMERLTTTTKKTKQDPSATTITMATSEDNSFDDIKLLFYQCSIAIESIGQTAQAMLKAIEQLYCTSIWD